MQHEDAVTLLATMLRNLRDGEGANYGYEVYLPTLARAYFQSHGDNDPTSFTKKADELVSHLYSPAWDLCRRGILRPGVKTYGAQATADGASGNGYSITPFGRIWLSESSNDTFVPTEPERFGQMIGRFTSRFGRGFHERGQEAVRCYGAHAYLACCSMCGAAAESILLETAKAKKNEREVLKLYHSASGRSKVENLIIGRAAQSTQSEYRGYTSLLKYWRDEASHGMPSAITDNEAYTALALLLRFAMFADQRWEELTTESRG